MKLWVFLVQMLLPTSMSSAAQTIALPDDIAVCEAVVMTHLEKVSAEAKKGLNYYFDVKAPRDYVSFSDAFFDKHKDQIPPFKRSTEFPGRQPRASGTPEFSWSFRTPKRIDDDTYTVWGGYYCGGMCALHCEYRVVRQQDKWIIKSTGECIAS